MEPQETKMYCYCLFCETVRCAQVARAAERLLECRAIYPVQVQRIHRREGWTELVHALTPGYVFLYAPEELDTARLRGTTGLLKWLRYSDGEARLQGEDERFALMLLDKDGAIGKTMVYREGERIRIKQGAFGGTETRILKVDRRNTRIQIEIPFAGNLIKTWVEYEMLEDAETK